MGTHPCVRTCTRFPSAPAPRRGGASAILPPRARHRHLCLPRLASLRYKLHRKQHSWHAVQFNGVFPPSGPFAPASTPSLSFGRTTEKPSYVRLLDYAQTYEAMSVSDSARAVLLATCVSRVGLLLAPSGPSDYPEPGAKRVHHGRHFSHRGIVSGSQTGPSSSLRSCHPKLAGFRPV